ncbi:MAG: hypothetical protein HKN85_07635 [Gammaproteobacteria bacterium]|nr:hypothetical protein [Gammaproteobacteria bacterium]
MRPINYAASKPAPKSSLLKTKWLIGLSVLLLCQAVHGQQQSAAELAEKMLDRIGGRSAWAGLKNTINGSQQNRTGEPTVVYAVITMDFEKPRFRIETTAQNLHLIRVIDGEGSWRLTRSGEIEDVPESLFKEELDWYASHLYRTIHRIAARDPALSLKIGSDGRLEIFKDKKRLKWFKLDAKGEPYAFGTGDNDVGSLSGPWDFVKDGIHHPSWVSSSNGTWRAAVNALDVNVPLHSSLFTRPADE